MGFFDDVGAQLPGGSAGGLLGNLVGGVTGIISNPVGTVANLAGPLLGATGMGGMSGTPGVSGVAGAGAAARAGLGLLTGAARWVWQKAGFASFKDFARYTAGAVGISIAYDTLFGENGPPTVPEGKSSTITIVRRVYENGYMENVSTEEGHPILMSRDYQKAKRVQRTVSRMHNKMPRRTVKQSNASKAKEAIEQAIVNQVTCPPPSCKDKC